MSKTLMERLTNTPEGMRLYQQERAIQEVTDLICQMMEEESVSRAQLAKRIGKTKGYVTQLLDGRTNMTVRTISDVFLALSRTVHFQDGPVSTTISSDPFLTMIMPWQPQQCWVSPTKPIPDAGRLSGQQRMVS